MNSSFAQLHDINQNGTGYPTKFIDVALVRSRECYWALNNLEGNLKLLQKLVVFDLPYMLDDAPARIPEIRTQSSIGSTTYQYTPTEN